MMAGGADRTKPGKKESGPRMNARSHGFNWKNSPVRQYFKKWMPMLNAPSVSSHIMPVPSIAVKNETFGFLKSPDAMMADPKAVTPATTAKVPRIPANIRFGMVSGYAELGSVSRYLSIRWRYHQLIGNRPINALIVHVVFGVFFRCPVTRRIRHANPRHC